MKSQAKIMIFSSRNLKKILEKPVEYSRNTPLQSEGLELPEFRIRIRCKQNEEKGYFEGHFGLETFL